MIWLLLLVVAASIALGASDTAGARDGDIAYIEHDDLPEDCGDPGGHLYCAVR